MFQRNDSEAAALKADVVKARQEKERARLGLQLSLDALGAALEEGIEAIATEISKRGKDDDTD